jgi:hypothetical protein
MPVSNQATSAGSFLDWIAIYSSIDIFWFRLDWYNNNIRQPIPRLVCAAAIDQRGPSIMEPLYSRKRPGQLSMKSIPTIASTSIGICGSNISPQCADCVGGDCRTIDIPTTNCCSFIRNDVKNSRETTSKWWLLLSDRSGTLFKHWSFGGGAPSRERLTAQVANFDSRFTTLRCAALALEQQRHPFWQE